ncbi:MAG: type VI secretion system domain-containing protein, partial [Longimicrobiales bacterium]
AYERAMERVRAGEPDKGIEMLIRLAAQEKSPRDRFLRRSQAASIMVETGREAVALPILEDLVREIDNHTLEEWEAGETVAQPLGLLFRCLLRHQGESDTTQSLYLRICRLDPLQAIQIAGQPAR